MGRTSFRVAVLVAMSFAVAASNAYAQATEPATPPTEQAAPEGETSTLAGQDHSDEGASGDDVVAPDLGSGGLSAPQDSAPQDSAPQDSAPQDSAYPTEEYHSPVSLTVGEPPAPSEAAPERAPAAPAVPDQVQPQRIDETPSGASGPSGPATIGVASSQPAPVPPATEVPPLAPPAPGPPFEPRPTRAGPKPGGNLERLLSDVGRELRDVRGQMHELRRGLEAGAPPRANRLTRLRTTLVRMAPMLVALEVQLGAAGRLSPHLRQLLDRVRIDLHSAGATAAGLIGALRSSRARSAELQLLLRELEAFQTLTSTLVASNPALGPAPKPPLPAPSTAYTQLEHAPAASTRPGVAGPPAPRADSRQAPDSSDTRAPEASQPWSIAPGSATASPAGSFFFFAGVAAITALLLGVARPELRARLVLPPSRRYAVAFLMPLERPG
jgi:hypothetical protein